MSDEHLQQEDMQHEFRGSNSSSHPRKLYKSWVEYWGDGGEANINYPVWICDHLSTIPESTRLVLANTLRAIDQCNWDVQPNGIVHDIVDPSLHCCLLTPKERKDAVEHRVSKNKEQGYYMYGQEEEEGTVSIHSESARLRGSFRWVPTVVQCSTVLHGSTHKLQARFLGQIAGLPERPACEALYAGLESIFSEMLPMFAKLDLREQDSNGKQVYFDGRSRSNSWLDGRTLQVIVKAQEYVLPPHTTYTGRWHTEGYTENIVAAGVYYIDITDDLSGGELSFRPPDTPDEYGVENAETWDDADSEDEYVCNDADEEDEDEDSMDCWTRYVKSAAVKTGTAAVFHNSIPHRFRSIKNETDEAQRRLFVNFFVVDRAEPLPVTTSTACSPSFLRRVLMRKGIQTNDVSSKILDFVGGFSSSDILHRKLLRDNARAAMSRDRAQWNVQHFGNSGHVRYHRNSFMDGDSWRMSSRRKEHSGCHTSDLGSGL